MGSDEILDDLHIRILRVTEDLRSIQQQLNCAAMQAPNDPELMEALCQVPEMQSLQVLKGAVDQMRHFLWFYMQVMSNDPEMGENLRQGLSQASGKAAAPKSKTSASAVLDIAADVAMLKHLVESKHRKPN